jgi:hypothetical protein
LNRWTKYAKRGFYIKKQGSEQESLKTKAARISRKATSVALKCSQSNELLEYLEKAIAKLDLEADNFVSKMQENVNEVPPISIDCATDTFRGKISFRIPQVVKGPKGKRGTISLEKNKGKKKKSGKKKGIDSIQSRIFSPFDVCIDNFVCLNVGRQDSINAENNGDEGANLEQFIVSHMTWTIFTYRNIYPHMKLFMNSFNIL